MKYSNTSALTSRVNNIITHNNDTEGNSELIDIRKGADGTTYETAGDAVRGQINDSKTPIEHYPFAETPSNPYTYALLNLKIIASTTSELYIYRIIRNKAAPTNVVHSIDLKDENGNRVNILNVLSSQYTEVTPDTIVHFNVNGIEGYYNIDWSKIPNETDATNNNNNGKGAKVNSLVMPNRLITDTALTKRGVPADGKRVGDAIGAVQDDINETIDVILSNYPFAETPSNPYTYALINLKIVSSTSDKIYIFRVARQAAISGNTVHSITLINGSGEQIPVLNVLSSQYTEVSPDTPVYFNKSGVEGYYNIDWDAIPVGTNAYNTNNNWKGAKVNSLVMPNRLITDTALEKTGVPADSKSVGDAIGTLSKEINANGYVIPNTIYGVVGKPFSIYYYNIFQIDSLDGYHVNVSPSSNAVENMGDRVRFSCATATTYNLSIDIRKNDNTNIAHKAITVTILPNSARNIKAIFIGDSFIADGRMVGELKSEFGNSMTLYGTIQKTVNDSQNNTVQIYTEGRSGWSLNDYLTREEKNNVTNAFWNGTAFDFEYYIGQHNDFSDVTDVFILSGPNDFNTDASTYGQRYAQIINSIRSYSNSIKIHCLMPLTCNCSGYAWGTRNYYSSDTFRYAMMSYGRKILDLVEDYSNVSAVPMYVYFDKDYNFPTTQVAVNDRTPTLVTVFNDNVHPNGYGYYSMSDMIYADIIATT